MSDRMLHIPVDLTGVERGHERVQALRTGFSNPVGLHRSMAGEAERLTREYLIGLNRHKTATGLGAKPTGHHGKAAAMVMSAFSSKEAVVIIPAITGLGRAFRDLVIRPGSGRMYLAIPAHRRTYGIRARDFSGELTFAVVGGRHTALMFSAKDDPDHWTVAYWLRREVMQKQDRTLLPSDEGFKAAAFGAADAWARELLTGRRAA